VVYATDTPSCCTPEAACLCGLARPDAPEASGRSALSPIALLCGAAAAATFASASTPALAEAADAPAPYTPVRLPPKVRLRGAGLLMLQESLQPEARHCCARPSGAQQRSALAGRARGRRPLAPGGAGIGNPRCAAHKHPAAHNRACALPRQEAASTSAGGAYQVPDQRRGMPKEIILYQYEVCPFCCKVKAFLDYHKARAPGAAPTLHPPRGGGRGGVRRADVTRRAEYMALTPARLQVPYRTVEVSPLTKSELKWSEYRKVPVAVLDGEAVTDSSAIISCLAAELGGAPAGQGGGGEAPQGGWTGWRRKPSVRP